MKLYCKYCKFYTTMEYDIYSRNFICQKCYKLLVGCNGYEILEFNDAGDLELYVTKDMFVYLHQNGYFKQLMKYIIIEFGSPQRSTSFNLTNMYNGKIILRKTEKNN